jgi:hypothetical protein
LITIFLFREGFGFFGQNLANLRLYRQAGLNMWIYPGESSRTGPNRRLGGLRCDKSGFGKTKSARNQAASLSIDSPHVRRKNRGLV